MNGIELFSELNGRLDFSGTDWVPAGEKVVLSQISHGAAKVPRLNGHSLRYVARGMEVYRIEGRTLRVEAGQFMYASQTLGTEVDVPRNEIAGTLGLCVFMPSPMLPGCDLATLDRPLVFSSECSSLGALLKAHMRRFMMPTSNRAAVASSLMSGLSVNMEMLLEQTSLQLDSLTALKKSTRIETLRKLLLARAYLHDVTCRAVDLQELAIVAGVSRFQLLRNFRDCFGDPPGTYHRKLRLKLAQSAIDSKQLDCANAADRYGFAGSSSLSHACRRTFGQAPVRTLGDRLISN